jgi:hypothetical protein
MPSRGPAGSAMRGKSLSRRERCGARCKLPVRAGFDSRERNVPVDLRRDMVICTEAFHFSGSDHIPRQCGRTIGVGRMI